MTLAVNRQIELQRNGEQVDSGLLKRVLDSYGELRALRDSASAGVIQLTRPVALGLDEADASRQNLEVYRQQFHGHFISATKAYYEAESAAFTAANSVSDYMKKAEARLQEEADRVNLYLHDDSRKDVSSIPSLAGFLVARAYDLAQRDVRKGAYQES